MEESKLTTTPADLERAVTDSLDLASRDSPAPADSQDPHEPAYQDGDLPDFSDDESDHPEQPSATPAPPRLVPGKGPKSRGKVPFAALKNRIAVGSSASSSKKAAKPPPAAPAPSSSVVVDGASSSADKGKGKGKSKALKLSPQQLELVAARIAENHPELDGQLGNADVQALLESLQIDKDVVEGKKGLLGKGTKDMASYKFWRTQPVPQLDTKEDELREGPLEPDKKPEEVQQEPVKLHHDFKWVTVDLDDPVQLKEVYNLLTHHYVEDLDASFRFDYSPEFIEWALKPPGYVPDWHVGIRVADTGKLVGFISGVPMDLRIRTATKRCTEINFLCVHKKLRAKRLAPLLIQEVTRRTHLRGIFQAIYTGGAFLPTPFSRCQYYHRNLNPAKLVKVGFSAVPRNSTVARMAAHYRVPTETSIPGLRELEKRDLKQASRLLRAYCARFDVAPLLSNKEIEHALWAGRGKDVGGKREGQVTWAYVVEDPETHRITDVFGFYSLPSTALKAATPTNVEAAYLWYYATTAAPSCADLGDGSVAVPVKNWQDETPEERQVLGDRLKALMADALVLVARNGFDVLNALTIQDNSLFLEDLKFGKGDGFLHFYLYNYATKPVLGGIDAKDGGSGVGVVMLCSRAPAMSTAASTLSECAVCGGPTPLVCATCRHTPFCQKGCFDALAATHGWICGLPAGAFTFAPLTASEKARLEAQNEDEEAEVNSAWERFEAVVGEHGWGKDRIPELLRQLTLGTCPIAEPQRSLILVEAHLVLQSITPRSTPRSAVSPWTRTAQSYRLVRSSLPRTEYPLLAGAPMAAFAPVLKQLVVYWTVVSPALKGFSKASVKRVVKVALERVDKIAQRDLAVGTAEEKRNAGKVAKSVVEILAKKKS